jgi:signal transduction histidine kinase
MGLDETFGAYVAHELKGPLTLLRGYAECFEDREISEEVRREAAAQIVKASEKLSRMIDAVRILSEAGRVKLQEVDLHDILLKVKGEVEKVHPEASIFLLIPLFPVRILGDPTLLEMAFQNLLGNSIRYAASRTQVEIKIERREEGKIAVLMQDWGKGIPKELLPRIFDPFFMVDPSFSKKKGGSGLGLSIVKKVMEAHRGEIRVESEEGAGTLCTLLWPHF